MNKKALHKISYGLYIVSSKKGDKFNGQIANTVFQATSEPPAVAVSINKGNLTHEFIQDSGIFAASILCKDAPMTLIGHFGFKSGRDLDKFKGQSYKIGVTGVPIILDFCAGYIEAEVIKSLDVGTHTIFVGNVIDADVLSEVEPMTYAYYHQIKGGKTPKAAATYVAEEKSSVAIPEPPVKALAKYECQVCGYIYDPEVGDPDGGIEPGTAFEDLPDDWSCPVCGASKEDFKKVE